MVVLAPLTAAALFIKSVLLMIISKIVLLAGTIPEPGGCEILHLSWVPGKIAKDTVIGGTYICTIERWLPDSCSKRQFFEESQCFSDEDQ